MLYWYRRHPSLGGGAKYVIVLGANEGGGVIYWKGAKEWAIERDSLKNKQNYVENWGYELDIVDMSTKKRRCPRSSLVTSDRAQEPQPKFLAIVQG